jgi:hypothetical protein
MQIFVIIIKKIKMQLKTKLHQERKSPIIILQSIGIKELNGQEVPHLNFAGVGYFHKQLDDGSYLLVSCGHTFWEEFFPVVENTHLFLLKDLYADEGIEESIIYFKQISEIKFGHNKNQDISVMNVQVLGDHTFDLFKTEGKIDACTQDEIHLIMIDENVAPIQITQKGYERLPINKLNFRGEQAALVSIDSPLINTLLNAGACEYPCYSIYSDQGASGSPIWNNKYELLGLNHGGQTGIWSSVATPEQIDQVINECGW